MESKHEYFDNFGNMAVIYQKAIVPYKGSEVKRGWILDCYAMYDNGFHYHRSVHDSKAAAEEKLQEFSCGTFKEINGGN